MDKSSIKLSDWQRILFGEAPPAFLLEALVRTVIIYCILLFVIRLSGKRMSGQLTSTEMAVMLVLGAIVSAAMQSPDRGIIQGIFLLFLILGFQQLLSNWMRRNEKVEAVVLGKTVILVKDGVLQLDVMDNESVSREQLFTALRNEGIYNLGEVKRLYLEATGSFNIYKMENARSGLDLLPDADFSIHSIQLRTQSQVCHTCGNSSIRQHANGYCAVCGDHNWVPSVNKVV
ncbi:MAG: DUF421 domain-containing protein [Pseudobacter sp.]|uniref:DUF421 domain-containing protein n=1 Tax=Pseudobacter sp. TaxID=2045420 RepID=UPI003F7D613A